MWCSKLTKVGDLDGCAALKGGLVRENAGEGVLYRIVHVNRGRRFAAHGAQEVLRHPVLAVAVAARVGGQLYDVVCRFR